MKKILTSFGFDTHFELLNLSLRTFYVYANRHQYDLFVPSKNFFSHHVQQKPFSWWKIELIQRLFEIYDKILWIDADVIICKFHKDIMDELNEESDMGMVVHDTSDGKVPNCGVWVLDKKCLNWLNHLWQYDDLPQSHYWWEQAAVLKMLGIDLYSTPISMPKEFNIPWTQLDYQWNPHTNDYRGIPDDPNFFHATMFPDRLEIMQNIFLKYNHEYR